MYTVCCSVPEGAASAYQIVLPLATSCPSLLVKRVSVLMSEEQVNAPSDTLHLPLLEERLNPLPRRSLV